MKKTEETQELKDHTFCAECKRPYTEPHRKDCSHIKVLARV